MNSNKNNREQEGGFRKGSLNRSIIAMPLFDEIEKQKQAFIAEDSADEKEASDLAMEAAYDIIIDLNWNYPEGLQRAQTKVKSLIRDALEGSEKAQGMRKSYVQTYMSKGAKQGTKDIKTDFTDQYVFARLSGNVISRLVELDQAEVHHAIYRIWPDFPLQSQTNKSRSTVKADAACSTFAAVGKDIVWGVLDSGIDGKHPHFKKYDNLARDEAVDLHMDFTAMDRNAGQPLQDDFGHGTHVAGIIAGEMNGTKERPIRTLIHQRNQHGDVESVIYPDDNLTMTGMAPQCGLVSLKVLNENGGGETSSLIAALGYVQRINNYGRLLRIHGVNMSVGYEFDPEWFACGQSPLCAEVNRLVQSGVVVVVAAGNTGYGLVDSEAKGVVSSGLDLTINDPGNADLAITVGSTHRDMPHTYGVSYFSSKGPTGDGRPKPDLVAPGEKIRSCATNAYTVDSEGSEGAHDYVENSGTSMAAPHVSGVVAAFLSIRQEFIGQPQVIKEIFLSTATDLQRDRYFQGHGLVDLMRALQSV